MAETCERSGNTLIKSEHDGKRTTECITCNEWEVDGEGFQLDGCDLVALETTQPQKMPLVSSLQRRRRTRSSHTLSMEDPSGTLATQL